MREISIQDENQFQKTIKASNHLASSGQQKTFQNKYHTSVRIKCVDDGKKENNYENESYSDNIQTMRNKMNNKEDHTVVSCAMPNGYDSQGKDYQDGTKNITVQYNEGKKEDIALPKVAVDIISSLQEEIHSLRLELNRLKPTKITTQSIQSTSMGINACPTSKPYCPSLVNYPSPSTTAVHVTATANHTTDEANQSAQTDETTKPTLRSSSSKRDALVNDNQSERMMGRWSSEEHRLFLQGLQLYRRRWTKVATLVKTRTDLQIRTHAQKYFQKLAKTHVMDMEELDGEMMDRLVEADLKSISQKGSNNGRYGGKRKLPAELFASPGYVCSSSTTTCEREGKKRARKVEEIDDFLSSVSPEVTEGPPHFEVGSATSAIGPLMPADTMGIEHLRPVTSPSFGTHEFSGYPFPPPTGSDSMYATESSFHTGYSTTNDLTPHLSTSCEEIDAETLDLLLHVDILNGVGSNVGISFDS